MTTNDLPTNEQPTLTEWVAIRDTRNPEAGRTIRRTPCVDVDHGDGSGHSERLDELGECQGTIRQIGAHWSNQPEGQAGWWCLVEYATPDYSRFCARYGHIFGSGESVREYAAYAENRAILRGIAGEPAWVVK